MSLTLTIHLSDQDLAKLDEAMKAARVSAASKSPDEIVAAATELLQQAQKTEHSEFIASRLQVLADLVAMLQDEGWALPDEDRAHVLSTLVYFADPKDMIPDHIPGIGFLDDAIMVELCARGLRHEIDAYDEFCDYRQHEAERRGQDPAKVGRADWLLSRREELIERMHRRRGGERREGFGFGYGGSSGYGESRSYLGNSWRPGGFRFR